MTRHEESERYKLTYMITSAHQGLIYDLPMLRAYVRRRFLVPEHRTQAAGFLSDHAWMLRHRGQTPSSIVRDIERELYGG